MSIEGSSAVFDPVLVNGGAAQISITVPKDAPLNSALVVNAEPSGTGVRIPLTVTGTFTPLPPTGGTTPPAETDLTPQTQDAIQPQGGTTFKQGQTVTVTVGTQYAGQTVEGWIFSTPTYLGTSVVSAAGTATFTIRADLPAGTHRLVVTDSAGTVIGWVYVQVAALAATGGTVAATGVPVLPWAAAVIVLGLALVVIRRRRGGRAEG